MIWRILYKAIISVWCYTESGLLSIQKLIVCNNPKYPPTLGIAPDIWVCGRKGCDYIRFYDRNKLYVALCSCLLKDENSVYVATPNDKSKKEAIEIINNICDTYVKDQIEYKDDYVIKFTNGSIIRVLSPEKEQDTTRGKKSSQIKFYDTDFLVSNEVLDEVLKPYIKQ